MITKNIMVKVIFQDADFAKEEYPNAAAEKRALEIVRGLVTDKAVQERFAVGVEVF